MTECGSVAHSTISKPRIRALGSCGGAFTGGNRKWYNPVLYGDWEPVTGDLDNWACHMYSQLYREGPQTPHPSSGGLMKQQS